MNSSVDWVFTISAPVFAGSITVMSRKMSDLEDRMIYVQKTLAGMYDDL